MTVDTPPSRTPYDLAEQAAVALAEKTGIERHDVALVLGSGWLPAVDALGEATAEIIDDRPALASRRPRWPATPARSAAPLRATSSLLVFLSRTHYYEGKGVAAVVHGAYGGSGRAAGPSS